MRERIRAAALREEFLQRADAARARLEQALDVLARVHEALRANHAGGVDQHGVGQLADAVCEAEFRREHVGRGIEAVRLRENAVLGLRAIARVNEAQRGILARTISIRTIGATM